MQHRRARLSLASNRDLASHRLSPPPPPLVDSAQGSNALGFFLRAARRLASIAGGTYDAAPQSSRRRRHDKAWRRPPASQRRSRRLRSQAGARRLPAEDPDRARLRRRDRDRRSSRRRSLSAPARQPGAAQARGHAAGVQLQAARRLQQDGAPVAGRSWRAASSAPRPATTRRAWRSRATRLGCQALDRHAGDHARS